MKRTLFLFFIVLLVITVSAHEFWLQPQRFFFTVREIADIRFRVGENFTGDNWTGNKNRIQRLSLYGPSGETTDLSGYLSDNNGDSLLLPLKEEGTHMIVFNSKNSFITLDASRFNAYLLDDGLSHIIRYRKEHKEENSEGKEYYQRSVKTVLQAGSLLTDACTRPTGLPLDIIPEKNPYSVPALQSSGETAARFQVLFRGSPLANALAKVWYYTAAHQVKTDTVRTDKKGWLRAQRHTGICMISCVYMEKNAADAIADWQSYWGSITFEYSAFYVQHGK